ncbi:MBL fold metallo-hydrolase [Accumulibacter sp.]|uniref:MBL fold metallo-hydrolase n=1 Tax=Accumulibacter sp. TaxID=2053492 RepID=UPI0025E4BE76|nr:MBL fold metallo-hydrolase [Accumulibacter sp.]MCM8613011.1 MBL fold metallo-hydrolase [Accumulibacter sp.]MCM8637066.1 MBL fold metallo-hydrolase [Accumulibacter sp.]MCM8640655.1 MBL fold metallo-hydrolase [Accumulibacter sp.]
MHIEAFFDPSTSSNSYLVFDGERTRVVIVDSVLDYDPRAGRTSTGNADRLVDRIVETGARVEWILETHVHADHLSAAAYLKERLGGRTGIGERVTVVQRVFAALFNAGAAFASDGSQFDHLFGDGETITVGSLCITVLHTPGHTPACVSYLFTDGDEQAVFVGDTLFMPDTGTARCDFPGGDAHALYASLRRLLALPPQTRLFLCHDYPPGGRPNAFVSTVGEQRQGNIHVHDGVGEDEFVELRQRRDATLAVPVLLLPAVQVNMRCGVLPEPEANGTRYLKIPLNVL